MTKHSEYFTTYTKKSELNGRSVFTLDGEQLFKNRQKLSPLHLQSLLLEHIDAQANIFSGIQIIDEKPWFIRDATNATPLTEQRPPDHPLIEANNMLLRTLATTRALLFAIDKRKEIALYPDEYLNQRSHLLNGYMQLLKKTLTKINDHLTDSPSKIREQRVFIKKQEKRYNTELVKILHALDLDRDIKNETSYKKLLLHYRYLASTLDEAMVVQTISYDPSNDVKHIETAYPITEKTKEQKKMLEVLKTVDLQRTHTNFQSVQPVALQEANAIFYEKIILDDRELSSQMRKSILPTVKNGYVVSNKLIFNPEKITEKISEQWSIRCATIAYLGKGESRKNEISAACDNLNQIQLAVRQQKDLEDRPLHFITLNTNSFHQDQNKIIEITESATKKNHIQYSYIPLNPEGTFRTTTFAECVDSRVSTLPQISRSERLIQLTEAQDSVLPQYLHVRSCASGADRTGTAEIATRLSWIEQEYTKQHKTPHVLELQQGYVKGGHLVFLARFETPGSRGLKQESMAPDYLSMKSNQFLYLNSAQTIKKAPLDYSKIESTLSKPASNNTQFDLCTDHQETFKKEAIDALKKLVNDYLEELRAYYKKRNDFNTSRSIFNCFGFNFHSFFRNKKLTQHRLSNIHTQIQELEDLICGPLSDPYETQKKLLDKIDSIAAINNDLRNKDYGHRVGFFGHTLFYIDGKGELDAILQRMKKHLRAFNCLDVPANQPPTPKLSSSFILN